jgi:hypothetical protein
LSSKNCGIESIQTKTKNLEERYLSIGTNDAFDEIGIYTHHNLTYSSDFKEDVFSFNRFPEKRFDFYTLNIEQVNELIDFFKKESHIYSMLGDRFWLTEGESCATVSHRCLKEGGINELLTPFRDIVSSQSILSPSMLAACVDLAWNQECSINKNATPFYDEFKNKSQSLKHDLEKIIKKLKDAELSPENYEGNEKKSTKPKS